MSLTFCLIFFVTKLRCSLIKEHVFNYQLYHSSGTPLAGRNNIKVNTHSAGEGGR